MVHLSMYLRIWLVLLLCGVAAWTDFRTSRIPNRLTLTGLALGLAIGLAFSGPKGLLFAATGAMVTALVPLFLFKIGAMGGGDVKLFAAIGSLLGVGAGLETQMAAFMIGGVQGVVIWARRGNLRRSLGNILDLVVLTPFGKRKRSSDFKFLKTEMRFGPAVFLGLVTACGMRFLS